MKTQHTHTNTWYDSRLVTNEKVKKKHIPTYIKKRGKIQGSSSNNNNENKLLLVVAGFFNPVWTHPTPPPISHTHTPLKPKDTKYKIQ